RLRSIQECAGSTPDCLPETQFTYQNGVSGLGAVQTSSITFPIGQNAPFMMDVNGDGREDAAYTPETSGSGTWRVAFANSAGGFGTPINTGISNVNFTGAIVIDYNADGKEDLLVPY